MKSGSIFWATFFIVIGVLGLLYNIFNLHFYWASLWKFWPLILVLLGLSVFLRDRMSKWILVSFIALLAAVVLFSLTQRGCQEVCSIGSGDSTGVPSYRQHFQESYSASVTQAIFTLDAGAGKFNIRDTTSDLISAATESSVGQYELIHDETNGTANLTLSMMDKNIRWKGGRFQNKVDVRLNPIPEWEMHFNVGAVSGEFDLSPFNTKRVSFDVGAASLVITLGSRAQETNVEIDAGASSLVIKVPKESGCEIRADVALSSKHFSGFTSTGENTYQTENFENNEKKIFITLDTGVSSISVERY
jgi:hypothetical protein